MKNLILVFILSFSFSAQAKFKSAEEAIKQLKSYSLADFAQDEEKEKKEEKTKETELYDDLDSAVEWTETNTPSQEFLIAFAQATALGLQIDKSWYAGEVALPVYLKHKKEFDKALKKLPKKDADNLKQSFRDTEQEQKKGNG